MSHVLGFRYAASFQNQCALKATGIENWGQILYFLTPPVKITEGVAETSE